MGTLASSCFSSLIWREGRKKGDKKTIRTVNRPSGDKVQIAWDTNLDNDPSLATHKIGIELSVSWRCNLIFLREKTNKDTRQNGNFGIFFIKLELTFLQPFVSWSCSFSKCFTYVFKTLAHLSTYSRKPGNYNGAISFEIDIMKKSSPIN